MKLVEEETIGIMTIEMIGKRSGGNIMKEHFSTDSFLDIFIEADANIGNEVEIFEKLLSEEVVPILFLEVMAGSSGKVGNLCGKRFGITTEVKEALV